MVKFMTLKEMESQNPKEAMPLTPDGSREDDSSDGQDESSSDNMHQKESTPSDDGDVNLDIMIDRKPVSINDLPPIGEKRSVTYGAVSMPSKLYGSKANIQKFIESKMASEWNITEMWTAWLKKQDLKTILKKEEIQKLVCEELESQLKTVDNEGVLQFSFSHAYQIFNDYDGKKKVQGDLLGSEDRVFLNLLVGADEFGESKNPELIYYVKEAHCHLEAVRLIHKYDTRCQVDIDTIEKFWDPRPNRRFCEILIFISQFFGRAEHVMEEAKVRQLWNTLPFVNDFTKALEHQSKLFGEKQKKQQTKKGQPGSTNRERKEDRSSTEDVVSSGPPKVASHLEVIKQEAMKSNKSGKKRAAAGKSKTEEDTPAENAKKKTKATKSAAPTVSADNCVITIIIIC